MYIGLARICKENYPYFLAGQVKSKQLSTPKLKSIYKSEGMVNVHAFIPT